MTWLDMPHELRHSMRACSKGDVRLRSGARLIRGRLHDFATDGLMLRADEPLGLAGLKGRCVHLEVRLDEPGATWIPLDGHVVRTSVASRTIAVALDRVPEDYEDCVQDHLLDAVEHDRLPHLASIDLATYRRTAIASMPADHRARSGDGRNDGGSVERASPPTANLARRPSEGAEDH